MPKTPHIIAWGEVLWDCLPRGLFLGGAPFNVAHHLQQQGVNASIASAVSDDVLGNEIKTRAVRSKVDTRFLDTVQDLPTGYVSVEINERGNASYTIAGPVAWDRIPATSGLLDAARNADAILFGSLAQRGDFNRKELKKLLAAGDALKVMDVNLRTPFDSRDLVLELAQRVDLLKLNGEELESLSKADGDLATQCEALAGLTGAAAICVTLGSEGAFYWAPELQVSAKSPEVNVVDTVGAGDAFMSAVLKDWLEGGFDEAVSAEKALKRACILGGYVASKEGATPDHGG